MPVQVAQRRCKTVTAGISSPGLRTLSHTLNEFQPLINMRPVSVFQAAFAVILLSTGCTALDSTWTRTNVQCLLEVAALYKADAKSAIYCTGMSTARRAEGALVAQFNKVTQKCSLFLFQSVCRHMVASEMSECHVFLRFPVSPQSMSSKLTGLWIADPISKLDNLVCQVDADTNRFNPVSVQWTDYGVQFNGVNAQLVLSKGNLGFDGGLTWLLRLKRQPNGQPFLSFFDCSSINVASSYHTEIWEWTAAHKLYASVNQLSGISSFNIYTPDVLTSNPDTWIDIGFTIPAGSSDFNFYVNGNFIPDTSYYNSTQGPLFSQTCVLFGGKYNSYWFNGTLRAIGIANTTMTEAEMRQFFQLVT